MDRQTSQDLMVSGRRVTRHQVKNVKRSFPILHLPAELRNIIYDFSIDFSTIDKYFDSAYQKVLRNHKATRQPNNFPRKKTPTIFLLNKQIFHEASDILRKKQTLTLSHGLLKAGGLTNVISANVIRQLTSIEITDGGHPIIKGSILPTSWQGYMTLIKDLGNILAEGHNLKSFLIDFKDERLVEHMTHCWGADYDCGFRLQMKEALDCLFKVHGIKKVILRGLNPRHSIDLRCRMQKEKATTFMDLPRELRDTIYGLTMDPNSCSTALVKALANWPDKSKRFPFPKRTTPSVLLLNKQIREEALGVLRITPLTLTYPAHHTIKMQSMIPLTIGFISRGILKEFKSINIVLESWEWIFSIDTKFCIALAASENLENFSFHLRDTVKQDFQLLPTQNYPDHTLHKSLKELTKIRGLKKVEFTGDLPLVYSDGLAQIMTSKRSIPDADLPKLKAMKTDGSIIEIDESRMAKQAFHC